MSSLTSAELATAKQIVGCLMAPPAALKLTALPLNSAEAAAGNAGQESSENPLAAGDGGVSQGLWQWQGSRLTTRNSWCAANGLDPTSVAGPCYFFLYELPTADGMGAKAAWLYDASNGGQPSRSLETLTADICQFYERPSQPDLGNRIAYAQQIAAAMGTPATTPTVPATPVAAPAPSAPAAASPPPLNVPAMTTIDASVLSEVPAMIESLAGGLMGALFAQLTGLTVTSSASVGPSATPQPAASVVAPAASSAATPALNLTALATELAPQLASQLVPGLNLTQFAAIPAQIESILAQIAKLTTKT